MRPSKRLVDQRIRNRRIEFIELVCEYEKNPPFDLHELVNTWEDWSRTPLLRENIPRPIYTLEEQDEFLSVDRASYTANDHGPGSGIEYVRMENTG